MYAGDRRGGWGSVVRRGKRRKHNARGEDEGSEWKRTIRFERERVGWVWDCYQSNYEALPERSDRPHTGAVRVVRGGRGEQPVGGRAIATRNIYTPADRSTSASAFAL